MDKAFIEEALVNRKMKDTFMSATPMAREMIGFESGPTASETRRKKSVAPGQLGGFSSMAQEMTLYFSDFQGYFYGASSRPKYLIPAGLAHFAMAAALQADAEKSVSKLRAGFVAHELSDGDLFLAVVLPTFSNMF